MPSPASNDQSGRFQAAPMVEAPGETTPLVLSPQITARQTTSRDRAYVLLGCSILQLPIWGFAMTYGLFQEYYHDHWTLKGSSDAVGVIGTTSNGVMYLSMPFLFAAFGRRWAHLRRMTAFAGAILACVGCLASSYSKNIAELILTQGVVIALGCVLIYSPTTLALSEHFSHDNRALAYGIVLSSKNITGSACPFLIQFLLNKYGFRTTMRIWMAVIAGSSLVAVYLMPVARPDDGAPRQHRPRKIPWDFLRHRMIYVYGIAIMFQSAGYGIAQSYLNSYAQSVISLSATSSTLLLTLFNAPGIFASSFFGLLSDNKRIPLGASTTTFLSALISALAAFFLWGFSSTAHHSMVLLTLHAVIYGFFAGGYSATWGGIIKEMEDDAAARNEPIDTGIVYGMLNGARGVGYVTGGLIGVPLLNIGAGEHIGKFGYATAYGPLILFTGASTLLGGLSVIGKCTKLLRLF